MGGYKILAGKTRGVVALNNEWEASRCGKGSLQCDNLSKTLQHKSMSAAEGQQLAKLSLDVLKQCVSLNN